LLTGTGLLSSYVTGILPALIVFGAGVGFLMSPSMNVATMGLTRDAGIGSAMVNTTQQVGGSVGTSLLNTLSASAVAAYALGHHAAAASTAAVASLEAQATLHGYHVAFAYAGIFLAAGAVVAGLLFRRGAVAPPLGAPDDTEDTDTEDTAEREPVPAAV
jgi:hypothetical protein